MLYSTFLNSGYWSQFDNRLIKNPLAKTEKAILVRCHSAYDRNKTQVWVPLSQCMIIKDESLRFTNYYLIKPFYAAKLKEDKIFIHCNNG